MADEGAPVGTAFFKFNVMKPRLKVNQAYVSVSSKQSPVAPCFIQLVLILSCTLVNGDAILYHTVSLAALTFRHEEDRCHKFRVLIRTNQCNNLFGKEFFDIFL